MTKVLVEPTVKKQARKLVKPNSPNSKLGDSVIYRPYIEKTDCFHFKVENKLQVLLVDIDSLTLFKSIS